VLVQIQPRPPKFGSIVGMELIEWSMCCMWCKQQTTTWSHPELIVAAHEKCLGTTEEEREAALDAWRMEHGFAYVVERKRISRC
jgi:hypothetical protein